MRHLKCPTCQHGAFVATAGAINGDLEAPMAWRLERVKKREKAHSLLPSSSLLLSHPSSISLSLSVIIRLSTANTFPRYRRKEDEPGSREGGIHVNGSAGASPLLVQGFMLRLPAPVDPEDRESQGN